MNITILPTGAFMPSRLRVPLADLAIAYERRARRGIAEVGSSVRRTAVSYSVHGTIVADQGTGRISSRVRRAESISGRSFRFAPAQISQGKTVCRDGERCRAPPENSQSNFHPEVREICCFSIPRDPSCSLPRKSELPGWHALPATRDLGVMLPYTPLQHLACSPPGRLSTLVMTSANRSSEPIAYIDEDAMQRLAGIADAFLIGERPIARRVDDSVVRAGAFGPVILRRSRGYAPGAVATIPDRSAQSWLSARI